jgi:opacity protein-like surface antigen
MRFVEQVWSGYAGADLGFAWGRFLFYATGGAAFSQTGVHELDRASTLFFENGDGQAIVGPPRQFAPFIQTDKQHTNSDFAETGWFAGGGVQFALSNKVSAGLEYRHTEFADTVWHFPRHTAISPGGTASMPQTTRFSLRSLCG